jgi:hypothetical protein
MNEIFHMSNSMACPSVLYIYTGTLYLLMSKSIDHIT